MEPVQVIRQLWSRKVLVSIVVVVAIFAAILSAYRVSVSPPGLHSRALTVGAASSQILIDSPKSALVDGASLGTFEALSTRAKIYGEYLSSLAAREQIAKIAGVPARSISSAGPFSPATGQFNYESQSSEDRANEILQEGAQSRLVFTGQEGVPILTVDAQAATAARAVDLANASFTTLKHYVNNLSADGEDVKRGVTVRELGAPEGGTIGAGNDVVLMALAFLAVLILGCAAILVVPRFIQRWKTLNQVEHDEQLDKESHPDFKGTRVSGPPPPHPHRPTGGGFDPTPLVNSEHQEPAPPRAAHLR
jgi:capsular polysaccharide biosynthesis protein